MGLDRDTLAQLRALMRPIANRVANSVARAVVRLADDNAKLQLLQVGVLADETIDGAEHFQSYGFCSVPLDGAEAVIVFPNGDRSHPLIVATSDRRYRPTGAQAGEVMVYNNANARIILKSDGTIEARSVSGTAVPLMTKADGDAIVTYLKKQFSAATGHVHATPSGPTTTITESTTGTTGTCPAPAGTSKLKGE